jgi:hypothetical protein
MSLSNACLSYGIDGRLSSAAHAPARAARQICAARFAWRHFCL